MSISICLYHTFSVKSNVKVTCLKVLVYVTTALSVTIIQQNDTEANGNQHLSHVSFWRKAFYLQRMLSAILMTVIPLNVILFTVILPNGILVNVVWISFYEMLFQSMSFCWKLKVTRSNAILRNVFTKIETSIIVIFLLLLCVILLNVIQPNACILNLWPLSLTPNNISYWQYLLGTNALA